MRHQNQRQQQRLGSLTVIVVIRRRRRRRRSGWAAYDVPLDSSYRDWTYVVASIWEKRKLCPMAIALCCMWTKSPMMCISFNPVCERAYLGSTRVWVKARKASEHLADEIAFGSVEGEGNKKKEKNINWLSHRHPGRNDARLKRGCRSTNEWQSAFHRQKFAWSSERSVETRAHNQGMWEQQQHHKWPALSCESQTRNSFI